MVFIFSHLFTLYCQPFRAGTLSVLCFHSSSYKVVDARPPKHYHNTNNTYHSGTLCLALASCPESSSPYHTIIFSCPFVSPFHLVSLSLVWVGPELDAVLQMQATQSQERPEEEEDDCAKLSVQAMGKGNHWL